MNITIVLYHILLYCKYVGVDTTWRWLVVVETCRRNWEIMSLSVQSDKRLYFKKYNLIVQNE